MHKSPIARGLLLTCFCKWADRRYCRYSYLKRFQNEVKTDCCESHLLENIIEGVSVFSNGVLFVSGMDVLLVYP